MCGSNYFLLLFILVVDTSGQSFFSNAYAKVAKWDTNPSKSKEEGRSNNGQSFFTQSSDIKLRGGQNLYKDDNVMYHYSMSAPIKTSGFQDRFNPPPAFQFGDSKRNVPEGHEYDDHSHNHDYDHRPSYTYSKGSYDSPISSYNPVASGIPDTDKSMTHGLKYPPFASAPAPAQDFRGPSSNVDGKATNLNDAGYQYNSSQVPMFPTPLPMSLTESQKMNIEPDSDSHTYLFPSNVYDHFSSDYDNPRNHNHSQPTPDYSDSDYSNNSPADHKPLVADIPEYLDHDPLLNGKFNKFPIWSNTHSIHNDYQDHHVYEPVTTTTTTAPPPPELEEEKRVNKGHYSYYYLGRKLYYIPLYFSVYFIIYITVLILKSIARHKVNFVHELDNVKGRSFNIEDKIDALEVHTTKAITEFRRRFIAI